MNPEKLYVSLGVSATGVVEITPTGMYFGEYGVAGESHDGERGRQQHQDLVPLDRVVPYKPTKFLKMKQ